MVPQEAKIQNFVSYLRNFIPISQEEVLEIILPAIEIRKFCKKELITKAGTVERYINFIEKGLVRKYYEHEGEEKVVQISIVGHLISSEESFYTRTPSEYYLEALEPATLISLEHHRLEKIYGSAQKFEKLGRLLNIQVMVLKNNWNMGLIRQSPRERFVNFMEKYPEILQRVPQKHLASYLNIKPETFSRFKHLMREGARALEN